MSLLLLVLLYAQVPALCVQHVLLSGLSRAGVR